MLTSCVVLMLFLPSVAVSALAADGTGDVRERLAKTFAGSYRFNYLFVEGCALYLDESSHLQLLELGKNPIDAQGKKLTARKEKIPAGLFVSLHRSNKSPSKTTTV